MDLYLLSGLQNLEKHMKKYGIRIITVHLLRKHTINQTKKLQELFKQDKQIIIEHAMRYGKPEIDKTLYKMKENGCTKIVLDAFISSICSKHICNCKR